MKPMDCLYIFTLIKIYDDVFNKIINQTNIYYIILSNLKFSSSWSMRITVYT